MSSPSPSSRRAIAPARLVELQYYDPLVSRARLLHGRDAVAWRRLARGRSAGCRSSSKPHGARAAITGESEPGYLDGIPPKRIGLDLARTAAQTRPSGARTSTCARAGRAPAGRRTTGPAQVYPDLPPLEGKRRLAQDFLWFCRLTDEDGKGSTGWLGHVRALTRRGAKLTKLGLTALELRGPGHRARRRLSPGHALARRPGGDAVRREDRAEHADRGDVHEPARDRDEGTFACTFPLSFQGRLIEGLRGEFRGGRLVRLEADRRKDRDFVAAYIDSDPKGNGRRLGEVALVDSTSRIGQSGRTYFHTLLDENAAAHIAFGAGFGGTRTDGRRGLNRSTVHLDVMIGGPDFEVTGITAKGKRVPVIADGLWQI